MGPARPRAPVAQRAALAHRLPRLGVYASTVWAHDPSSASGSLTLLQPLGRKAGAPPLSARNIPGKFHKKLCAGGRVSRHTCGHESLLFWNHENTWEISLFLPPRCKNHRPSKRCASKVGKLIHCTQGNLLRNDDDTSHFSGLTEST